MKTVAIVDTSIFCNVLDIPGKNESKEVVYKQFKKYIERNDSLLLPMATIYETGNHIAQIKMVDGNKRRKVAERFVKQVRDAIDGESPWQAMQIPTKKEVSSWLSDFPMSASSKKSMGDLSIIKEWEKMCGLLPHQRIFIWALDTDLQGYDSGK